jgi:hypothetical protein|tara:strand:- start:132 stop:581 length:450 start_codon:yes stop_codon:yes gene_type:complete
MKLYRNIKRKGANKMISKYEIEKIFNDVFKTMIGYEDLIVTHTKSGLSIADWKKSFLNYDILCAENTASLCDDEKTKGVEVRNKEQFNRCLENVVVDNFKGVALILNNVSYARGRCLNLKIKKVLQGSHEKRVDINVLEINNTVYIYND